MLTYHCKQNETEAAACHLRAYAFSILPFAILASVKRSGPWVSSHSIVLPSKFHTPSNVGNMQGFQPQDTNLLSLHFVTGQVHSLPATSSFLILAQGNATASNFSFPYQLYTAFYFILFQYIPTYAFLFKQSSRYSLLQVTCTYAC